MKRLFTHPGQPIFKTGCYQCLFPDTHRSVGSKGLN
jgi:hypothetical protein